VDIDTGNHLMITEPRAVADALLDVAARLSAPAQQGTQDGPAIMLVAW
jgi:hypothetical protein